STSARSKKRGDVGETKRASEARVVGACVHNVWMTRGVEVETRGRTMGGAPNRGRSAGAPSGLHLDSYATNPGANSAFARDARYLRAFSTASATRPANAVRRSGSSAPDATGCPPPPSACASVDKSTLQSGERRKLTDKLFAS